MAAGTNFKEWRPSNLAGGLCLDDLEWKIRGNQSPSMLNVWYKDRIITKRMGQDYVNSSAAAAAPILSIYEKLFKTFIVFACSTKLYKMTTAGTVTEIMSGLTANKGTFFLFNDILYYINGAQYVAWTGTGSAAAVVPYIPVVVINRDPTTGGDANENYNRLGAGFTTWFDGDNTATAFTLPQTGLDATAVTAEVDGVAKTETTHFTVDRTTGIVTFTYGTPTTGTNNVKITAYKTSSAYEATIKGCEYAIAYGGELSGTFGGTRMFFGDYSSNYVYWSGLNDPTYFPEQNFNLIGSIDDGLRGFGKQYDLLIIFKPNETYSMGYSFNGTTASFPTKQLSSSIGCDCPYTIQLINNRLTWLTSYSGVCTLVSTELENERNIQIISQNINGTVFRSGILSETVANLRLATSTDRYGHYWLCVGTKAWLWNYDIAPYVATGNPYEDGRKLSWWYFESINANCWSSNGDILYYGDRTTGKVVFFQSDFDDFGNAITARWKTALNDFEVPDRQKTAYELWVTTRVTTYSVIDIYYYTDLTGESDPIIDAIPAEAGSFSWDTFTWDTGTWDVINYLKTFKRKPKLNDIQVFSVEFRNDDAGKDLAISDLVVRYKLDGRVK